MKRTGQARWKRAKEVIPGGNMLLSKRGEMLLPENWPSYYSRSEGCRVWDMDGVAYDDLYLMGVGTNTLGYAHPEVNSAVTKVVQDGALTTLNAPEEVALAERLIDMHPFAEMARFCRTGGEANAVAVRIARAAAGRDKVAFCGYHGWHDWYLAANLSSDDTLSGHLLPGLEPNGVPSDLQGSVRPFVYNDRAAFDAAIDDPAVGVIFMEVSRNAGPAEGYLEYVRTRATERDIVLIFDECTSGFRETFGGLHLKFGVDPDISVLGKTIGNGFALTAIIGTRAVMEAAQTTFISSTFWTERIGLAAALETLKVMEREKSWDRITDVGLSIRRRWLALAEETSLDIEVAGLPALGTYGIKSARMLEYKTYITQEMMKAGFLAGNAVYASLPHEDDALLERYFNALAPIWQTISQCEKGELDIASLLEGPVCHAGFKRLN